MQFRIVFFSLAKSHVSNLHDMKKRIRTVDLGCGRVGATVSGMLFVHRIPVSYAKHKTSASSTPKICWQFDL